MTRQITAQLILASIVVAAVPARGEEIPDVRKLLQEALEAAKATGGFTFALYGIPSALARAGDAKAALQVAEAMNSNASELEKIAIAQAKAGALKAALQTARSIANEFGKSRALAQLAGVQAEQGDVKSARETAARIADAGGKAWAFMLIARAEAKTGQVEAALETAKSITDEPNFAHLKFDALSDIALVQAKAGDVDAALQTAAAVRPDYYKARLLADIAEVRANARDAPGAERILKRAVKVLGSDTRTEPHGFALAKIATVQMKLADRETARKTFRQALQATGDKNQRLIVWAQAKAGDVQGAIENAGALDQGLELIAVVQAEFGHFKEALVTTDGIKNLEVRSTALAQVGAARRAAGYPEDAKHTFQKALETARAVAPDRLDNAIGRALYSIAYYQAKSGDALTALDWARKERSNFARSRALLGLAEGILDLKESNKGRKSS